VSDADAFDEFYRSSRQRLYATLYALTGDAAEAQDAAQEAYVRAWQRWSAVSAYADPEAWVRTVGRRIAVSRWRRARNALTAHRRTAGVDHTPGPDADTVALVTALRELPLPQRTAIVLHHIAGRTVADISRETGVPEGTVKARLVRGRRALAALLDIDTTEDLHV
jgi:RNA polymerase sigma-70 factor (ECF subfamily)